MAAHDLHEEGWWDATIVRHALCRSKSGTLQVRITFSTQLDKEVTVWLAISPNAIPYTRKKLEACGYTGSDVQELNGTDMLVGREVRLRIVQEADHAGEQRSRVKGIYPKAEAAKTGPLEMTLDEIAAANALLQQTPCESEEADLS